MKAEWLEARHEKKQKVRQGQGHGESEEGANIKRNVTQVPGKSTIAANGEGASN
jgi:hypothetical protein